MKYFEFKYTSNQITNIKIGLVHYLLSYYENNGSSYISSSFIQSIFRSPKLSTREVFNILYNKGFIENVNYVRTFNKYYSVKLINSNLISTELPEKINTQYYNNMHLLDRSDKQAFQKVLNYKITITYEQLEIELSEWKKEKQLQYGIDKNITLDELWNKILTHNNKIDNGIKCWNKDNYSGRIWHFLDQSPSFLRQYTNKGKLIELDIVQCQPILLALIEEKYIGINNEYSKMFYNKDFDIYKLLGKGNRQNGKLTFYNILFGYGDNEELKSLLPNFYERMNNIKQNKPELIGIKSNDSRLKIKDSSKYSWIDKNWKFYKAINLACQLKEVEIFEQIWSDLFKSKTYFIPVHDAVYIYEKDLTNVTKIIKDRFDNEFKNSKIKYKIKIN